MSAPQIQKQLTGLTGNIGSGKSTVGARLRALGAYVLDADRLSRALLEPDGACFAAVTDAFGSGILRADGTIDRKALAAVVFSNEAMRERLNAIVHPAVIDALLQDARAFAAGNPHIPIILDVPLLIECGMHRLTGRNVLVCADEETRLTRILARDGCTRGEALSRMRAQMPESEKRLFCRICIDNNGSLPHLYEQTDALYEQLLAEIL